MSQPDVDIVIPHHDPRRNIERAVRSVISGTGGRARAIVVCHNMDASQFDRALSTFSADERSCVEVLHHQDGIKSPTGPFNVGLDSATSPYVGILGSDDFFEPHALSLMWREAESQGSDVVLAPLYFDSGRWVATPRTRPLRTKSLEYVRDRLAYRTAPLGLMRRSAIEDRGLRMTVGVSSGVDIAFSTELFTSGTKIDLAKKRAAYVIGTDAPSRVTFSIRPVSEELKAISMLAENPVLQRMTDQQREALAIKITRIHILGTLSRRSVADGWQEGDLSYLQATQRAWQTIGGGKPRVNRPFNRADRLVLDALESSGSIGPISSLALKREQASSTTSKVFAKSLTANLHRESTLRAIAAEKINRLAYSR